MPLNNNFTNDNIKFLRKQTGISQEKMSNELKINQATIAKWESNSRNITLEWALKLANYFNVYIGDFISTDLKEVNKAININKLYIASNLKYLRQINNKTQEDIAKLCKKKNTAISNWELGLREPSAIDLSLLSNYFNVSIDNLLLKDLRISNANNDKT